MSWRMTIAQDFGLDIDLRARYRARFTHHLHMHDIAFAQFIISNLINRSFQIAQPFAFHLGSTQGELRHICLAILRTNNGGVRLIHYRSKRISQALQSRSL